MIASITTTETVPWGVAGNMVAYLMEPVDVLADHADNPLLVTILENLVGPIKRRVGVDNAVSLAS